MQISNFHTFPVLPGKRRRHAFHLQQLYSSALSPANLFAVIVGKSMWYRTLPSIVATYMIINSPNACRDCIANAVYNFDNLPLMTSK